MINPSQRPLPDNTQHSQQTNIHAPGGIRTHNLSRQAAEDLSLRPRGYWNRQCALCILYNSCDKYKIVSYTAPTDWSSLTKKITVLPVRYDPKLYKMQIRFYLYKVNTGVHILVDIQCNLFLASVSADIRIY